MTVGQCACPGLQPLSRSHTNLTTTVNVRESLREAGYLKKKKENKRRKIDNNLDHTNVVQYFLAPLLKNYVF